MFPPNCNRSRSYEDHATAPAEGVFARNNAHLGFTLFELLIVLFLVALCMGSVTLLYRQPSAGAQLKTAAVTTASRLRDLRVAAMSTSTERVAVIDTASRSMRFDDRRAPLQLSKSFSIRVTAAENEKRSPAATGIRFYPNGSSSGGTIVLRSKRQGYEIRVNWLTGRVSTSALP